MRQGVAASAQDHWSLAFKMGGGQTFQDAKTFTGNAGYAWGGDFELGYRLSKDTQMVYTLGYRFFPGDFQQVSLAPATLPVQTAAGAYTLDTRIRKAELEGFQLGVLYRENLTFEGYYWQAGLRVGINRAKVVDTGTSFTQTVTTANTAGSITKLQVINSQQEKKTFSPGVVVGLGYRFTDTYSLEANAYTLRAANPVSGNLLTGSAYELIFGIRF